MKIKKKIVCLVGPSASGKTAIGEWLRENDPIFQKVKTTTTRKPRVNEDENAYFFVTKEQFEKGKEEGIFLETSNYAGEMYGTPKFAVDSIIYDEHKVAIVPIDINGALAYKELYGNECIVVFVYRDKRTLIESVMERDIPLQEKSKRIVQIDKEYDNLTLCDRCVINNTSIEDAAEVIKGFVLG